VKVCHKNKKFNPKSKTLDARSQAHSTSADKSSDKSSRQSSFPWRTVAKEKQLVLRTLTTIFMIHEVVTLSGWRQSGG
jgi:hypothetical protein